MNTVNFEISKDKTIIKICGSTGSVETCDITDTDIENDFVKLLKKVKDRISQDKIMEALDINSWVEQ